jgi:hypothetical protein
MRLEISNGVATVGGFLDDDGSFCPSLHTVLDAATMQPIPGFSFSGNVWPDPFHTEFVSLDDPMTVARARIIVIGGETAESVEIRAGYKRGFYGKRAAPDSQLRSKTRAWVDGYLDGRRDKLTAAKRA